MVPLYAFLDNPVLWLVLGAIAVMLYGERLPEVARSFGKGVMELRKGVRNLQREFEDAVNSATTVDSAPQHRREIDPPREEPTAPKFEPPPGP